MLASIAGPRTRRSLLRRLRKRNDHQAWTTFVDAYEPLVSSWCRWRGLQAADAQDVFQEVLAEISRTIHRFKYRPEIGAFRGWLRRISDRKVFRLWRKQARAGRSGGASEEDCLPCLRARGEVTAWEEEFTRRTLRTALARIRPCFGSRTWQAFEMLWLQGLSPGAVADRLKMPIDQVYVEKHLVLKRLRQEVKYLAEDSPLWAAASR
jgi:RNA polymerase sigma-70 factor (ECF subfamily)